MKKLLLLIHLLLVAIYSNAQSREELIDKFEELDSTFYAVRDNNAHYALELSMEQKRVANQLKDIDTLMLKAELNIGNTLFIMGVFDETLKHHYSVLKKAEEINDLKWQGEALNRIAIDYEALDNLPESTNFYLKCKTKMREAGIGIDTIYLDFEIGFNMIEMGDPENGLPLMENALKVAKTANDTDAILWGLDNLANVNRQLGNYEKALQYHNGLYPYQDYWRSNYYNTIVYQHASEIYYSLGKLSEAQRNLDSAFIYVERMGSNSWLLECYAMQTTLYHATGNYKEAWENQKKYIAVKDSVYREEYNTKVSALNTLYELEAKENKISLLEKDAEIATEKLNTQRTQRNAIITVALLLLALGFAFVNYRNQLKTQKLQTNFSRELISTQEGERQRISKELHDSVGQNILFIKNQLSQQSEGVVLAPVIKSVDIALEEVRSISKELYPNQLEKYGFTAAINTLVERVNETTSTFTSVDLNDIENHLSRDMTINLYRIVQEGLSNAIKHANATAIRITGNVDKGKILVIIQDNGKGFDKGSLETKSKNSSGLLNLEERVKLFGGKFDLETAPNKGTKLIFTIPTT